jgi:hypothetical protein
LLFFTSNSRAEPDETEARAAARALGYAGVEAYQAGDYRSANDKLTRAFALLRAPSLGLWSARTLVKLGDLAAAAARYRDVVAVPIDTGNAEIQNRARLDANRELNAILPRLAHLSVSIEGAQPTSVEMWLDDVLMPADAYAREIELNPGSHRLRALHVKQRIDVQFDAAEGEARRIPLRFGAEPGQAIPPPRPQGTPRPLKKSGHSSTQRTLGFVAMGAGGAGLVFGTVTGAILLAKKGDLDDNPNCDDRGCLPSERDRVSSYNSLRTPSTIGFIAGAALEVIGVALVVLPPPSASDATTSSRPQVHMGLGPSGATLRGSF